MHANIVEHRRRQEAAQPAIGVRRGGGEQAARFGRGCIDRRHREFHQPAGRPVREFRGPAVMVLRERLQRRVEARRCAGAPRDRDVRKAGDSLPLAPRVESFELVRPHDQHQRGFRPRAGAQVAQRVDRVGGSAALDLVHVEHAARLVCDREFDHVRAVRGVGDAFLLPRLSRRDQVNLRDRQIGERVARQLQVPDVDRVEAAAQQADRFARHQTHSRGRRKSV
jgi:hypothetical protein